MKKKNRYDFSSIESEKPDTPSTDTNIISDPRINFRIANCCASCRWFRLGEGETRKGYCRFKIPSTMSVRKQTGDKRSDEEIMKSLGARLTHITNVCDGYELKKARNTIIRVIKATNLPFDNLGNVIQKEDYDFLDDPTLERDLI